MAKCNQLASLPFKGLTIAILLTFNKTTTTRDDKRTQVLREVKSLVL